MMPLEEVSRVASKAVENTRTMGIALFLRNTGSWKTHIFYC